MYKAVKYYVSNHHLQGLLLHSARCKHLPDITSRAFIGSCYTVRQALTVSASQFSDVTPCPLCTKENATPAVKEKIIKKKEFILEPASRPTKGKAKKGYVPVKHLNCWQ
ncbi:hypothetical protein [Pantoea sp. KPR_PJ]|uniref:hypothetical protein n=1 Tax=Pantoea sp. KPR_PJ TaxID=2738375 RepID=UPI0035294C7B